jgi:hypothetical protein
MKTVFRRFCAVCFVLCLTVAVSGCGKLPPDVDADLKLIYPEISKADSYVRDMDYDYNNLAKWRGNYNVVKYSYNGEKVKKAKQNIQEAESAYRAKLSEFAPKGTVLKKPEEIRKEIDRVRNLIADAQKLAKEEYDRMELVSDIRWKSDEMSSKQTKAVSDSSSMLARMRTSADRSSADFPVRKEDIEKRYAEVKALADTMGKNHQAFKVSTSNPSNYKYDYPGALKAVEEFNAAEAAFAEKSVNQKKQIDSVPRAYSKRLVDMKEEASLIVGRESWNPNDTRGQIYYYKPRPISIETYDLLAKKFMNKDLAVWNPRKQIKVNVDKAIWDSLKIDASEGGGGLVIVGYSFYIEDMPVEYFHKYEILADGQKTVTDWEQVPEEYYVGHYKNLGMDVLAKPKGLFEDEALTVAVPSGMAFVNDPAYGEWREDETAEAATTEAGTHTRRYWHFFPMYSYYYPFGGYRYYHNDWSTWDHDYRGRRAYYGAGRDARYGTHGSTPRRNTRYASSTFSKRGGFSSSDASVRGAGPGGRGGGPGGRGK